MRLRSTHHDPLNLYMGHPDLRNLLVRFTFQIETPETKYDCLGIGGQEQILKVNNGYNLQQVMDSKAPSNLCKNLRQLINGMQKVFIDVTADVKILSHSTLIEIMNNSH